MLIASVERRIEDAYASIEITAARRLRIERSHQRRRSHDVGGREQRLAELMEQSDTLDSRQEKLLDLYYSEGIPRQMHVREQKKLSQELARVKGEQALLEEDTASAVRRISEFLGLLDGAHARYLAATPDARKQTNNALLNRILIGPGDKDLRVELRDEVSAILTA